MALSETQVMQSSSASCTRLMWWDYCGEQLINSYPTYFRKFQALVEKIEIVAVQSDNADNVANLGLPADIYHLYLMAREIGMPLKRS